MKHSTAFFLRAAAILWVATSIGGCDLFGDDEKEPVIVTDAVVVANGGNFGDQNGTLSMYDPDTKIVSNSADLGGFAHAIAVHDGKVFVLLNTFSTGRIAVVDGASRSIMGQIQNVPSPRGIAFVNEGKALASNLSPFGASGPEPAVVSVIDLTSNSVETTTIQVGLYPEGLVSHGDRAYVANSGNLGDGTTLSVINTASNQADGSIELGCDGPNEVFVDADDELIVVCEGKVVYNEDFTEILEQTNGQIIAVNPANRSVVSRTMLTTQAGSENGSQSAYYDPEAEELYVIDSASGTIYRYDTSRNALAATMQVPDQADLVGMAGVAYDGTSGTLYVARLARGAGGFPDFSAAGAVVMLGRSGSQVGRFTVGPAPTHIEFLRSEK